MKLSAYHYAVALRGLVAGTRYTLPMSWPVATDYLISLEACTLSPDPPDAAALEPSYVDGDTPTPSAGCFIHVSGAGRVAASPIPAGTNVGWRGNGA